MKPEIEDVREKEEANYEVSQKALGDTTTLVQDIVGLYKLLGQLIEESGLPLRGEIVTAMAFLATCRYQLIIACLAIERGHLTDSCHATRAAVEACAFANRINAQPDLAMVWLEAGDNEEAYRNYRREFSGRRTLFPDDQPLMAKLGERYDTLSKQIHASLYSLCRRVRTERTAGSYDMVFRYFEVDPEDRSEPARTFLFTIDIHVGIIKAFAEILREAIDHDRLKWEINLNSVEAKVSTHNERWASVFSQRQDL